MSATVSLVQRNGIGEEYEVEYDVIEACQPHEGVQIIIGRERDTGTVWGLAVADGNRLIYALSPVEHGGRDRVVAFAMGYRAANASKEGERHG